MSLIFKTKSERLNLSCEVIKMQNFVTDLIQHKRFNNNVS